MLSRCGAACLWLLRVVAATVPSPPDLKRDLPLDYLALDLRGGPGEISAQRASPGGLFAYFWGRGHQDTVVMRPHSY